MANTASDGVPIVVDVEPLELAEELFEQPTTANRAVARTTETVTRTLRRDTAVCMVNILVRRAASFALLEWAPWGSNPRPMD